MAWMWFSKRRPEPMDWTRFNKNNRDTYPKKAGKYLIYRKGCDKMHFEQWNGNGWASSNNDCTHYCSPNTPID